MTSVVYDGSFEGFLTAVFEVYEYKFHDPALSSNNAPLPLFGQKHVVHTSSEKAERVLKKLRALL
ncbi:MAG: DNA metabolism protein, partial [Ginsengibacter sp.]